MSDDFAPSYHEAGHAVAAREFGLDMIHVSIRKTEDSLGRCSIQNGHTVDNFTGAIVMVAGHVAERMALERENCNPNWLLDDHDMESARLFIENSYGGDINRELNVRQNVQLRARVLLRARWDAVTEVAELLQRNTTVLGEDVAKICLAEAARRSARLAAAKPPKPKPTKKPRQGTGAMERRPFKIQVKKRSILTADPQLAEVDRQIAAVKAQLDQYPNDPPECWPLRKKLVGLHNKRQELLAQQGVFDR